MNRVRPYNKPVLNFSNIFLPKSRSHLRDNSNIAQKENRPNSKSPSKPVGLSNIPEIQRLRETNKISLNGQKMKAMFERLEVQEKASRNFMQRTKTRTLYLNYTYSPFIQTNDDQEGRPSNQKALKNRNLVQQFNRISKPSTSRHRQALKQKAKQIKRNNSPQQKGNKKKRQLHQYLHQSPNQRQSSTPPMTQLDHLDVIVNIEQQKFQPNTRNINIFSILFDDKALKTNEQTLNQYKFCYDSVILISSNQRAKAHLKIQPLFHISTYNRQIIKDIITDETPEKFILTSGDINLQMDRIQFLDMVQIASNKLSPNNLSTYMKEMQAPIRKKAENKQTLNEVKDKIAYPLNTVNTKSNEDNLDQEKIDLRYYGQATFNRLQMRQKQLAELSMKELREAMQTEIKAIQNTIQDRKTLKAFKEKKDQILLKHLHTNSDLKMDQLMKEVERKIRSNKMSKNRAEKIKIQTLNQSLRMRNQMESKSRNKSKRPV